MTTTTFPPLTKPLMFDAEPASPVRRLRLPHFPLPVGEVLVSLAICLMVVPGWV